MNTNSNLAFNLELETEAALPGESYDTAELNAAELDRLLRLGSRADVGVRPRTARRGFAPVTFRDNHSTAFRPFKVY